MGAFNSTIERLVQSAAYAMGLLLLFAVLVNFANVVGRYVLLRPIIWAEEIILYSTIWTVFIGLAVVAWRNIHLRMDVIYELLPPPLKRVIAILISLVTLWLCAEVVYLGYQVVLRLQANNQRTPAAGIPIYLIYWALPIGFALTAIVAAVYLVGYVTGSRRAEQERSLTAEEIEHL
jgi:TRAP-type C4-dicarboxylate transport system permease small subunit